MPRIQNKTQRFGNRNCSFPQMIQIEGSCSVGSVGAAVQLGLLGQLFSWVCWGSCSVGFVGADVQLGLLGQLFSWVCWGSCSVRSVGAAVRLGLLGQLFGWVCWGSCSVGFVGAAVRLGLLGQMCSWVCWGSCSVGSVRKTCYTGLSKSVTINNTSTNFGSAIQNMKIQAHLIVLLVAVLYTCGTGLSQGDRNV
jgi:hypothetical protein